MIKLSKKLENRMRIQKNKFYAGELAIEKQNRPELDKVHYHEDGHIVITNTYSAIQVADVHDGSLNTSDENKDVGIPYPESNQLFEFPKSFQSITLPTQLLEDLTNDNQIRREMEVLNFNIKDEQLRITPSMRNKSTILDDIIVPINSKITEQIEFNLSPRNFNDAMNFFRMTDIEEVTMLFEKDNRPIHFVSKNIHYVIAPMFLS